MALLTKSQQVETYVRKLLASGNLTPGMRIPSDRELVSKFGVSLMTVREALIRLTKDGLIERKQGSGTHVAEPVRKATIGILANVDHITSASGYFYLRLINEFKEQIEAAGLRSSLFIAHNQNRETCPSDVHLFDRGVVEYVAGVISLINLSQLAERLDEEGICAVSLPHAFSRYSVVSDYEAMTRQGAQLLHDRGYHEFALMHFDYSQSTYDTEVRGRIGRLLQEVREYGHADLVGVPPTQSCEHAYEIFKGLWAGPRRPRAIFFYDDGICDVATRAILELGIKVPDELAILTMSNIGRKFAFPVPLTAISFDPEASIKTAWTMLSQLINGKTVEPATVRLLPRVQFGRSLGESG